LLSLNLRLSTGMTLAPISLHAALVQQELQTLARADAVVMAALRADIQVLLQFGAIEHRLAGSGTCSTGLPGTTFLAAIHATLIFGGMIFWNQLMLASSLIQGGAHAGQKSPDIVQHRASGAECSISWTMRLPITTASATSATWRAVSASRMPKPTPTGRPALLRIIAAARGDFAKVKGGGAGHAFQGDVIDEAARQPCATAAMRASGVVGASR
jgi:hypothetical protein